MRLLLVEDNITFSNNLKKQLKKYGYAIDIALNSFEAKEFLFINQYDVILLDLNLPDENGLIILRELRLENNHTPVIIVSAKDAVSEITKGLDLGADDYITKPFSFLELYSRIKAVLRRSYDKVTPIIKIGCLTIDVNKRIALIDNEDLFLLPKEFDILEYLAFQYPKIVSAEEIMEHLYNEEVNPFSSVLRVHITRLRKKIELHTSSVLLTAIRGKGYQLCEMNLEK